MGLLWCCSLYRWFDANRPAFTNLRVGFTEKQLPLIILIKKRERPTNDKLPRSPASPRHESISSLKKTEPDSRQTLASAM